MSGNGWTRDGVTYVNSGEIAGMDAPNWGSEITETEIVGDDFTSYYRRGDERASFCYYVVAVTDDNETPDRESWEPDRITTYCIEYVFHYWHEDDNGVPDDDSDQYEYDSASVIIYHHDTAAEALKNARSMADNDESYVLD